MRSILQFLVRLLLGAISLPLICAAFFAFSLFALGSDRRFLHRLGVLRQKWIFGEHRPLPSGVPVAE